jgi:predicted nucleotidyltransferase
MALDIEIIQKLESYFRHVPRIVGAYLFGSFARGSQQPLSDVDIAVLLDDRGGRTDRILVIRQLVQEIGRLLRKDVHVLILNEASYLARIEAIFRGRCLHVGDEDALVQFKMLSISMFTDFAPFLDLSRRRLMHRLGVSSDGK